MIHLHHDSKCVPGAPLDTPQLADLAFRVVDADGDGLITVSELKKWVTLALEHEVVGKELQLLGVISTVYGLKALKTFGIIWFCKYLHLFTFVFGKRQFHLSYMVKRFAGWRQGGPLGSLASGCSLLSNSHGNGFEKLILVKFSTHRSC